MADYICEKCGASFKSKPSRPSRFCSRACCPGRPTTKPNEDETNWHIERIAVRAGREFAAEQQARFLDLFTGHLATWARRCVYKRVLRETCAAPSKVNAAINAVLVVPPGEIAA